MIICKYVLELLGFFPPVSDMCDLCGNYSTHCSSSEQHLSDKIYLLSSPSANLIGLCIFTFFHLTVKCGYLCGLSYYQHNACLISVEKDSRKVNTVEGWGVVVISVVIHLRAQWREVVAQRWYFQGWELGSWRQLKNRVLEVV